MLDNNSFLTVCIYAKVLNYLLLISNDSNINGSFQTCLRKFVLFCAGYNKQEVKQSIFRKANQPVTHKRMFKFQLSQNFVQNSQISPSVFLQTKMRA